MPLIRVHDASRDKSAVRHLQSFGIEFAGLRRGVTNVIQRYMIQLEAETITPV